MNTKRALQAIHDVIWKFDLEDRIGLYVDESAFSNETELLKLCESLGITKRQLESGIATVPDRLYQKYPLFNLLYFWNFSIDCLSGRYGALRTLKAIFGDKCTLGNIPSKQEEDEMITLSVQARCNQKMLRINELFPDTYPLELPVLRFHAETNSFISFENVYVMADSYDAVIQRFSDLFFAAMKGDLPEDEACELNLLSTFLDARDAVMRTESISYRHIQKYRATMQAEGYTQLESYVSIRRVIPFWMAREFYNDAEYFIHYAETHAHVKEKIRRFLSLISAYECTYLFIKDMEEHLRREKMSEAEKMEEDEQILLSDEDIDPYAVYVPSDSILVPKESDEITESDCLLVERGNILLKRAFREYNPCVHNENLVERLKRRYEWVALDSIAEGNADV